MIDVVTEGKHVLEDCDLFVLTDLEEDPETGLDEVVCYYIGYPEDFDAGLRGFALDDNTFKTKEEAYIWAYENREDLLEDFGFEDEIQ